MANGCCSCGRDPNARTVQGLLFDCILSQNCSCPFYLPPSPPPLLLPPSPPHLIVNHIAVLCPRVDLAGITSYLCLPFFKDRWTLSMPQYGKTKIRSEHCAPHFYCLLWHTCHSCVPPDLRALLSPILVQSLCMFFGRHVVLVSLEMWSCVVYCVLISVLCKLSLGLLLRLGKFGRQNESWLNF